MKKVAILAVLLAVLMPAVAEEMSSMPDLVGNWTGTLDVVKAMKDTDIGQSESIAHIDNLNRTLIIDEQNGQSFTGRMISADDPELNDTVLGVIALDNESLTLVDEDAYIWGYMISPTEMELFHQEVGTESMSIAYGKFTMQ